MAHHHRRRSIFAPRRKRKPSIGAMFVALGATAVAPHLGVIATAVIANYFARARR